MKKNLLFILTAAIIIPMVQLQGQGEDAFVPGGEPVFQAFSNIHSSFDGDETSSAFELSRLYLGYEYAFSKSFSARANIDIGNPGAGNLQMTAYVKLAYLQYRSDGFMARTGMISTDAFSLIDRHWGYRFIAKTLQDEYGMNPSADLGLAFEFSPAEFISFDVSALNGEGFRSVQSDDSYKYTAGMTLRPVEGLIIRGYTDFLRKVFTQNTISMFLGYTYENLRLGVEYASQRNNRFVNGNDFSGISGFASYGLNDKFGLVARYDNVWSVEDMFTGVGWNVASDGQQFIAGFEYLPVEGIRVAPVYKGWKPADGSSFVSTVGLYFEFRL
jgi:hypothetical protein